MRFSSRMDQIRRRRWCRRWARPASTSSACKILGSGLWEDPQIFTNAALEGAWYAGPDATGFRNFSSRFRARYGQDPARTASLAYDAVALISALVKTQGDQRFSEQVLINSSGFTGIDGLFRFRADGTNQRGLAVMKVTPAGGQVISPAPKGVQRLGSGMSAKRCWSGRPIMRASLLSIFVADGRE